MSSKKEQIENDYKESDAKIEAIAEEELKKIRKKANEIKAEAEKIGEDVENSLNEGEAKRSRKKS